MRHVPQLDGLRGIAILLVMLYHFVGLFPAPHGGSAIAVSEVAQIGWVGVDLFFVLSGFLITGILYEAKRKSGYFRNFYARRFLRIFPLYYATLILFFIIAPLILHPLPQQLETLGKQQVWLWTYTFNWLVATHGTFNGTPGGYFWSLSVEEQFYLVWPFIVLLASRRSLVRLCFFLFWAVFALRLALLILGATPTSVYAMTVTHMDGLVIGALVYLIFGQGDEDVKARGQVRALGGMAAVGLVVLRLYEGNLLFWNRGIAAFGFSLLAIFFAYALLECTWSDKGSRLYRLVTSRFLTSFGKYSYALYIMHLPIAHLIQSKMFGNAASWHMGSWTPSVIAFLIIATTICWMTAFISWHVFEMHFLRLKRFFYSP